MAAVKATPYSPSAKMGLQMKRRFWEEDDRIFGGHLYSNLPFGEFSYPSNGYFGNKGVILGFYGNGQMAGVVNMPVKDRITDSDQTHHVARFITDHVPLRLNVPLAGVRSYNAVLFHKWCHVGQAFLHRPFDILSVIRMKQFCKCFIRCTEFLRGDPKDAAHFIRPIEIIVDDVPIIMSDVRNALCMSERVFTAAQLILYRFAPRDVHERPR